jgi:hypothetical protein
MTTDAISCDRCKVRIDRDRAKLVLECGPTPQA